MKTRIKTVEYGDGFTKHIAQCSYGNFGHVLLFCAEEASTGLSIFSLPLFPFTFFVAVFMYFFCWDKIVETIELEYAKKAIDDFLLKLKAEEESKVLKKKNDALKKKNDALIKKVVRKSYLKYP